MNRKIYLILLFVLVLVPAYADETEYGAIERNGERVRVDGAIRW